MCNDDSACCGSGCTNCVLDLKPTKHALPADVCNVFDRTYKRFRCDSIQLAAGNVFLFRFRHVSSTSAGSECVIIPPGCHLLLRALKNPNIPRDGPADDRLAAWREQNATLFEKDLPAEEAPRKQVEKHDKSEDDLYVSRPYTPISFDRGAGTFEVLVKMEPGGMMTDYLLTMSVGTCTEWKGVYGDFTWQRNQYPNLVAFVQGVAIAPVYSTMRAILADEDDDTRLTLCACFRDLPSVLLRDELRSMATYWNFKHAIYLSRRSCACSPETRCRCVANRLNYNEPVHDRRLEATDIEHLLRPFSDQAHSLLVLLCGTASYVAFIRASLERLKIENCYIF